MNKKQFSLFIGRFQPLHQGHKKLIKKVLDEGKNVCIGLRDTPINKKNPYNLQQRAKMFFNEFPQEFKSDKIMVVNLPDVVEVCHGRKVGWKVREIRLDEETENISATKIRNNGGK